MVGWKDKKNEKKDGWLKKILKKMVGWKDKKI